MKFTPIYNSIKEQIEKIDEIKIVNWWNGQSADMILHTSPAVYVEFPGSFNPQNLNGGKTQRMILTIRISLISKLIKRNDGRINSELMAIHESNAMKIYESIQKMSKEINSDIAFNSMTRKAFQLNMNQPGAAITIQDFETSVVQNVTAYKTEIEPDVNISHE